MVRKTEATVVPTEKVTGDNSYISTDWTYDSYKLALVKIQEERKILELIMKSLWEEIVNTEDSVEKWNLIESLRSIYADLEQITILWNSIVEDAIADWYLEQLQNDSDIPKEMWEDRYDVLPAVTPEEVIAAQREMVEWLFSKFKPEPQTSKISKKKTKALRK